MFKRSRLLSLVAVMSVLVAACGGGGATSTNGTDSTTSTTADTAPTLEAVVLSYGLVPGAKYIFELSMDQSIDMTTTGDPAVLDEEGMPREMSLRVSGPTTVTYAVAEGPDPGTFEVTITSDLSGFEFDATVDGESATGDEIPEFADLDPIEVTAIVDEKGNPVGESGFGGSSDLFGELFGDLGGMGPTPGAALDPGRFFGPVLTDDEVEVGDSWTETIEMPLFGDDVATTTITSTIVGTESVGGADVFVIETSIANSEIRFDMAEFFMAMFEGFLGDEPSEEDLAMLEELRDQLRFVFTVDAAESVMTTKFDPERGLPIEAEVSGENRMAMDVNAPDETTGEMVAFTLDMRLSQRMSYRLVDSSGA